MSLRSARCDAETSFAISARVAVAVAEKLPLVPLGEVRPPLAVAMAQAVWSH